MNSFFFHVNPKVKNELTRQELQRRKNKPSKVKNPNALETLTATVTRTNLTANVNVTKPIIETKTMNGLYKKTLSPEKDVFLTTATSSGTYHKSKKSKSKAMKSEYMNTNSNFTNTNYINTDSNFKAAYKTLPKIENTELFDKHEFFKTASTSSTCRGLQTEKLLIKNRLGSQRNFAGLHTIVKSSYRNRTVAHFYPLSIKSLIPSKLS